MTKPSIFEALRSEVAKSVVSYFSPMVAIIAGVSAVVGEKDSSGDSKKASDKEKAA